MTSLPKNNTVHSIEKFSAEFIQLFKKAPMVIPCSFTSTSPDSESQNNSTQLLELPHPRQLAFDCHGIRMNIILVELLWVRSKQEARVIIFRNDTCTRLVSAFKTSSVTKI